MKNHEFVVDTMIKNINNYGWSSVGTENDDGTPIFYTIGVWQRLKIPELIVTGISPRQAHMMASSIIELGRKAGGIEPGSVISGILVGLNLKLREPDNKEETLDMMNLLKMFCTISGSKIEDVPVLQIEWPDEENRFYGQDGFSGEEQIFL